MGKGGGEVPIELTVGEGGGVGGFGVVFSCLLNLSPRELSLFFTGCNNTQVSIHYKNHDMNLAQKILNGCSLFGLLTINYS